MLGGGGILRPSPRGGVIRYPLSLKVLKYLRGVFRGAFSLPERVWAGPQGRSPSSQTEVGLHPSGGVLAADPATRGQVCRLWAARRSRGLAGGSGSARLAEPDGCPIRRAGPPGRGRTRGVVGAKPLPLGEPRVLMRSVKTHTGLLLTKVTKPCILYFPKNSIDKIQRSAKQG